MFTVIQFPLADLRYFLANDTGRLMKPAWPVPRAGRDFVRAFGALCKRPLGGIENWPGEDYYCQAARGVKLADGWQAQLISSLKSAGSIKCAFRRLLADGVGVARIETAFDFRETDLLRQIDPGLCLHGFSTILAHARGRSDIKFNWRPSTRIASIGPHLARHYLRATTKQVPRDFKIENWWVQPCEPLMVIQHVRGQFSRFPSPARKVELPTLNIELHYLRWQSEDSNLSVWFLGFTPGADKDFARRLRLHVLRLHAEYEFLRQVLRSIAERELPIVPRSESCDNLQQYLAKSMRLLMRASRFGLPQSELLKAVLYSRELLSPGERETLLSQTQMLRGNIKKNLERFTQNSLSQTKFTIDDMQLRIENRFGDSYMSNQSINFGDNAKISGSNLTVAGIIRESSIAVQASSVKAELKVLLGDLHSAVEEMIKYLGPDQATAAARDLAQLTQEVTSSQPRKKWYELSAQGLIDAASSVGAIAGPVLTAVMGIFKLLQ